MIDYMKPKLTKIERTASGQCAVGSQVGVLACGPTGTDVGTDICVNGTGAGACDTGSGALA